MIIRNAYKAPVRMSKYSTGSLFIFSVIAISFFIPGYLLIGFSVSVFGLIVFIYAIALDHKAQGYTVRDYTIRLRQKFQCPSCNSEIREPVEYEEKDGVPILYACRSCEVFWYAGNYAEDT